MSAVPSWSRVSAPSPGRLQAPWSALALAAPAAACSAPSSGAGIPEDQAKVYENDVKDGGIMMGVHPKDDKDRDYLKQRYDEHGADNVYYYDAT